jgi:hypothetical protein
MKESTVKTLKLNKQSISDLNNAEMKDVKAGGIACWENLWTVYHCDVVYTREPEIP